MFENMTRTELEKSLETAQEELDEIDEMRMAILGQSGIHVGAKAVQQYHSRFDNDQKRIEERIAQILARLDELAKQN